MIRSIKLVAALAVAAMLFLAGASLASPATAEPGALLPASLAAAAHGTDRVSLLVLLRLPEAAGKAASELAAAELRARLTEELASSWEPMGLTVERRYASLPIVKVSLPGQQILALAADPMVAGVSPIRTVRTMRKEGKALIRVGDVQNLGFRGAGIGIAILDTGVDYTHGELKPGGTTTAAKTVKLYDAVDLDGDPADEQGHGTGVAGIAAGSDGGVAPQATIVAVRVLNDQGEGTSEQILAGLDAVLTSIRAGNPFNIRVINMSLGGYDDADWPPRSGTCDSIDAPFAAAFGALTDAGVLIAVAAGNGGCTVGVSWPACMSTALAVGAVYDDEVCSQPGPPPFNICLSTKFSFSSMECRGTCEQDSKKDRITCYTDSGDKLGVFAPADCAKTTKKGGGYEDCFNGTSAATPYVAGATALLAQAYPYLGPTALRTALEATGNPRLDERNGITRRRVDVLAALQWLAAYCPAPGTPQALAPLPGSTCAAASYSLSWGTGSGAESYHVQRSTRSDFSDVEDFTATTNSLSLTWNGPSQVTIYHRVRAEKACGSYSSWSGKATISYTPKCPRVPRRHLGS